MDINGPLYSRDWLLIAQQRDPSSSSSSSCCIAGVEEEEEKSPAGDIVFSLFSFTLTADRTW
jgi:hypothetical protein